MTLIKNHENLSVYFSTGEMLSSPVETNITKVSTDIVVEDYLESEKIAGPLLECSKLSIFGTEYRVGHYIILPSSTNECFVFGRIVKLLCDEENAYFMYHESIPKYCPKTDLYFVDERPKKRRHYDIIMAHHLPDYRPLESYEVGESKQASISIRNYLLQQSPIPNLTSSEEEEID